MFKGSFIYHLLAVLVVMVWGTTFVFSKMLILHGMRPAEIFLVRFAVAYLCIWIIPRRRLFADSWRDELLMALLGVTGGSLYFLTENIAVGISYANNVSFIVCTTPLVTALLAIMIFRDVHATRRLIGGSLVALLGMGIVVFNGHFVLRLSPAGDLLALAAAVCWAVYSILMRGVSKRYDAVFITRKVFFYGIVTILPVFLVSPWTFPLAGFQETAVWGNLLFLGVVASFACFAVWSLVIKKVGAISSSNYVYLNPISTVVASALLLDEPMTAMAYVGSVLILGGVVVANRKKTELS